MVACDSHISYVLTVAPERFLSWYRNESQRNRATPYFPQKFFMLILYDGLFNIHFKSFIIFYN